MDPASRKEVQERFLRGDVKIMVATVAFGMGIDKPDIRFIVHYDLPKNLENYCQETGRAGRDGKKSDCILFFSRGDLIKLERMIDQGGDETQNLVSRRKLRQMADFCESSGCRRRPLLTYFGEPYDEPNCQGCDNCLNPRRSMDGTSEARKIASCISQLGERFGATYVAEVLHGSRNARIIQNGHHSLPAYAIGKEHSAKQWASFIRELVRQGLLRTEGDEYPVIKLTEVGYQTLSSGGSIELTSTERTSTRAQSHDHQVAYQTTSKADRADIGSGIEYKAKSKERTDQELLLNLKELRKRLAESERVPPYMVFHDSSLKEMVSRRPCDLPGLRAIPGVGDKKLKKYGAPFLQEIREYCNRVDPLSTDLEKPSMLPVQDDEGLDGSFEDGSLKASEEALEEKDLASEDLEGWFSNYNQWSFARYRLWQSCRRAYHFEYIAPALRGDSAEEKQRLRELKGLSPRDAIKGKLIHKVIGDQIKRGTSGEGMNQSEAEEHYSRLVEEFRCQARDKVAEHFNGQPEDEGFFEEILQDGLFQIGTFFGRAIRQLENCRYLGHESLDSFYLDYIGVTVKIDYLGLKEDGRLLLLDWKTGSYDLKEWTEIQAGAYVLWAMQSHKAQLEDICCRIAYLKNGKVRELKFQMERLEEIKEIISKSFSEINMAHGIEGHLPDPSQEKCLGCQFSSICSSSMAGMEINCSDDSAAESQFTSISSETGDADCNAKAISFIGGNIGEQLGGSLESRAKASGSELKSLRISPDVDLEPEPASKEGPAEDESLLENAFTLKEEIDELKSKLDGLIAEYNRHLDAARDLQITEQGNYRLERTVQMRRAIEVEAFRERYPETFLKLASVPVSKAEETLGIEALEEMIRYMTEESYLIRRIGFKDQ
jgi:CRISPR/Cas system-associated exonuclease Cas4 (RecB family)